MGLPLFFNRNTWQMSDRWVGLREGETSGSAVVVSQIEKRVPFSFQSAFKRGFQPKLLSGPGPSQGLCKNSLTTVVIDAAAPWRQLGEADFFRPCFAPALPHPTDSRKQRASEPGWMHSLFGFLFFIFFFKGETELAPVFRGPETQSGRRIAGPCQRADFLFNRVIYH